MSRPTPWYRRLDWWIILILALTLAVRIAYLLFYRSLPDWTLLKMDHWYHHHWAQSIAGGNILGDTTYFRAPLYAYCLGALYAVFGDSLWVGRLFGVAIGLTSVLLLYLIGKRVFGRTAGLIAASLQSVYPMNIYLEAELLLDPLFTLLILAALNQFLRWHEKQTLIGLAATGALLSLSAIARPNSLVLAAAILIWMLVTRIPVKARLANLAALLCGLAIFIAPVFVRNLVVAGDPVLIASQAGVNLYVGNNEAADGASSLMPEPLGHTWRLRDLTFIAEQAEGRTMKPGEISSYWGHQAVEWIFSHPLDAAQLYARKLCLAFGNREISNNRNIGSFFASVPYFKFFPFGFAVLFGLATAGAAIGLRHRFEVRVIVMVVVCICVVNAAFFVNSRFRQPIIPLLILLVSYTVAQLPDILRAHKVVLRAAVVGLIACIFSLVPLFPPPTGVNIQPLLSRALSAYADGDYRASLAFARQASQLNDSFPEVNLTIGAAYFRLQVPDSAVRYFNREIRLHPERAKAYANLGSLCLVNRQFQQARAVLERARKLQPYDENAGILWIRAHAQDSAVPGPSVMTAVQNVLLYAGGDITVVHEAAAALVVRGYLSEAAGILDRGMAMKPPAIEMDDFSFERDFQNSPERFARRKARLFALRGYVYGLQQDYDGAVRSSKAAINLDPLLSDAYANLVSGLIFQGNNREADSLLSAALSRFPDNQQLKSLRSRLDK